MSDVRVKVHSDDADRELRRFALFISDLRPFWPRVTRLFIGWMREQFESEGRFGGRPWAPLAPSTIEIKRALGLRLQILQAYGQMKQAASRPERIVSPSSLTLVIDDSGLHHGPVLQYHQTGGGRLPARPLVFGDPLPPAARAELRGEAEGYVRDLLRRL